MVYSARLRDLREKFPREALELDLVSGRVSPETGEFNPEYESDSMQEQMELNVLEVINLIAEQGHTGFTHDYLLNLLIPLLKGKPIMPLSGKDWEWDDDGANKRCYRVFKAPDGTSYFSEGYAFSTNGGKTFWTGSDSRKLIEFPCSSKELETKYIIRKGE